MAKTVASKTRVIPVNDYAVGVYDVPVQNIANNVTGYTLSILRCTSADPTIWPDPGSIIRVEIMFSFDNGQTFVEGGAFEAFGGIHP